MLECVPFVEKKVLELVLTIYPRRMEFGPFWLGFQYLHIKIRIISMEINSVTVEDIVRQHWATYGRHYYTRYDHENVDAGKICRSSRADWHLLLSHRSDYKLQVA
ncbi:uncharacterized protein LOC120178866 [Hibiscus syriacus]|uniref:uncharacterized protein LOC120178866 n=1 Tax=Hibiscus syriacus TaxID=106335 RepID=UPI001921C604|nr:uncharacterized protein LOC120178866 [Hibiscus syriacus]